MIVQIFKDKRFIGNLFPMTDEALEVIQEHHPESDGWQVKVLVADGTERE